MNTDPRTGIKFGDKPVDKLGNMPRWKHGYRKTRIYRAWQSMMTRCYNPNFKDWHLYGGKGITVCDRWKTFEYFLCDMGDIPGKDYSLDRKDSSKNYEPDNCRWATKEQQARNTNRNRIITHNGLSLCASEWSLKLGGNRMLVARRLFLGWPEERAVTVLPH